jgi:hypothetical protein
MEKKTGAGIGSHLLIHLLTRAMRGHLSLGHNRTQYKHFMDNGSEYMKIRKGVSTTILRNFPLIMLTNIIKL